MVGDTHTKKTGFSSSDLMRVDRVARVLDVTKKRVYNLILEGKLEAIKLGPRQTRVLRESLEQYINRLIQGARYERGYIKYRHPQKTDTP